MEGATSLHHVCVYEEKGESLQEKGVDLQEKGESLREKGVDLQEKGESLQEKGCRFTGERV